MKQKLKSGIRLYFEDIPIELTEDAEVDFIGVDSIDVIAEHLATNPTAYALHRDDLAHEETVEREVDGAQKTLRVKVTYGLGGARQEEIIEEVKPSESRKVVVETKPAAAKEGKGAEEPEATEANN